MTGYRRAQQITEALAAAGVRATCDPRNVNPPCVLVTPPALTQDLACNATAEWRLLLILPGPFNADAWAKADQIVDTVAAVFDLDRVTPNTTQDPPIYEMTFEEAV